MEIILKDNGNYPNLYDILLRKNNQTLKIIYGGNGDLYFDVFGGSYEQYKDGYKTNFEIDKEDQVYPYFERLIEIIKEAEVFTLSEEQIELIDDPFEVHKLVDDYKRKNEKLKGCYPHTELVKDDAIELYSDSIYNERANRMLMRNSNGKIELEFFDNPDDYIDGFGIRICNSGSKYMPFNICFMRFFNKLHEDLTNTKKENAQKK